MIDENIGVQQVEYASHRLSTMEANRSIEVWFRFQCNDLSATIHIFSSHKASIIGNEGTFLCVFEIFPAHNIFVRKV